MMRMPPISVPIWRTSKDWAGCRTLARLAAGGTVQSAVKGKPVDTGRETLGVTLADGVEIGERCLFSAGVKVWPSERVPAGEFVQVDIFTV